MDNIAVDASNMLFLEMHPFIVIAVNTIQYNTIVNTIVNAIVNTIQYNTITYNTIQYHTIQYNKMQSNKTHSDILHCLKYLFMRIMRNISIEHKPGA